MPGSLLSFPIQGLGKNGNEGGRQGSFPEELTEGIGNTIGHKKSIGVHAGTEEFGDNHVSDEAQEARDQYARTDGPGRSRNAMSPGFFIGHHADPFLWELMVDKA
jgi:hypothetical protein